MRTYGLITQLVIILLMWSVSHAQWSSVEIETNGYDQSEPAVAYSPANSNYLMAVWNDWRPDQGNAFAKPGYAFSTDNGGNWSRGLLPTREAGYQNGYDPSCAFDRNGNAYYCYIAVTEPNQAEYLGRVFVSTTSDLERLGLITQSARR
jgi:hypothetical protein